VFAKLLFLFLHGGFPREIYLFLSPRLLHEPDLVLLHASQAFDGQPLLADLLAESLERRIKRILRKSEESRSAFDGRGQSHRRNVRQRQLHYPFHARRGVTRLDGARGKKQILRPHVRT